MDTQSDSSAGDPADPRDVIIRDDQSDFPSLLDAAKVCRKKHRRLRLIDSGKLSPFELEWLGEAGANIYTSDHARRDLREFILIRNAVKRGEAVAAYFHNGRFDDDEKPGAVSFPSLKIMAASGCYLYISNGRFPRDYARLEELAFACLKSGSRLVFYLHRAVDPGIEDLCRRGAWVHIGAENLARPGAVEIVEDGAAAARAAGSNIIVHVSDPVGPNLLEDLTKAGVCLRFHTPPSDYRSRQRSFELRAEGRT